MAGNVPLFCPPHKRSALVEACAAHVARGGALVAGFELGRGYGLDDYDSVCLGYRARPRRALGHVGPPTISGATKPQEPSGYAVSVHRRLLAGGAPTVH